MKTTAIALSVLLGTLPLGAPASAHAPADGVRDLRVEPRFVVVKGDTPSAFRISADLPDGDGATDLFFIGPDGVGYTVPCLEDARGVWDCEIGRLHKAGRWKVRVAVATSDGTARAATTFWIKRATRFSGVAALPRTARKGKKLAITGRLWRAPQDQAALVPAAGRSVKIQFRPAGTSRYIRIASTRTNASGRFTRKVTAKRSGTWRAIFKATNTHAAAHSPAHHVKVR